MKKKIIILLISAFIFANIAPISTNMAAAVPALAYKSKVLYIGGDKLFKYPNDNCQVPVRNTSGYQVKYEVTSGKDLVTISDTGKVKLTNNGIGTAIITVTYSKKGANTNSNTFYVYVRRNAQDVKLTKASEQKLNQPLVVGEELVLQAAKSYDGSYGKGHYGLDNYKGIVSDNIIIESSNPEVAVIDGFTLKPLSEGSTEITVKAYQNSQNQFTGVSKTYTIHVTANDGIHLQAHSEIKNNVVTSYFPRWSPTLDSYMYINQDNTISIVESLENKLVIETYNETYKLLSTKEIMNELPLFGAFYSGDDYNYIAFGQENKEENENKEVIRIVKYDKSFNRIDSVSINNCYTIIPFSSAAGRMGESLETNRLILHTSRLRYTSSDGVNHQSQLTIEIDTKNMTVINDLGEFQSNHVSHSFDQYILYDNEEEILVDHGDAYPRSIAILREQDNYSYDWQKYEVVDAYQIPGKTGANCTGVSIGGVEITQSNYIIAMNTINHSLVTEYTSFEMVGLPIDQRDILVCVIPKDSFNNESVRQITLGKYDGSDKIASIPKLIKIDEDKLMVMWQEFDEKTRKIGDVNYVFIDGNGNQIGDLKILKNVKLSDCDPIFINNKIVWYTNDKEARYLFVTTLD